MKYSLDCQFIFYLLFRKALSDWINQEKGFVANDYDILSMMMMTEMMISLMGTEMTEMMMMMTEMMTEMMLTEMIIKVKGG